MDKTININLGGSLFQVDEEAFIILRDYIQSINTRFRNVPGGPETIEDIESRIAEIFRSQKGLAGVISKKNVQDMISVIGKPEDFDIGAPNEEFTSKAPIQKKLYRNPDDSVISGVCGGLGAYLNTDPVLFRVLFVLFALFGFIGALIYGVLWIAVPPANTEAKKREMYGGDLHTATVQQSSSGFSEIMNAIGKVFFMIFRFIAILFGAVLVITGFLTLFSFLLVYIVKYPGAFSFGGDGFNISYIPDMLKYIFTASAVPWIKVLLTITIVLPLLAIIYWGLKMIFWFRSRDGIISLAAFIIWILAVAGLSVVLFNQGVSFAESASSVARQEMKMKSDTLFVVTDRKMDDLEYDNEFSVTNRYNFVVLADSDKNLHIRPNMRVRTSDNESAMFEVQKRSSGRTRRIAQSKAESLEFNYHFSNDTLHVDEYFTIPAGNRWSGDFIWTTLRLPENTIVYFDSRTSRMVNDTEMNFDGEDEDSDEFDSGNHGGKYWRLTHDGLKGIIINRKK